MFLYISGDTVVLLEVTVLYTIGESELAFEGDGSLPWMNQKVKDEEVAQKRTQKEGLENPTSVDMLPHQTKAEREPTGVEECE